MAHTLEFFTICSEGYWWHRPSLGSAPPHVAIRYLHCGLSLTIKLDSSVSYDRIASGNHAARLSPLHLIQISVKSWHRQHHKVPRKPPQCSTSPLRIMLRVSLIHIDPRIFLNQLRSRRSCKQPN